MCVGDDESATPTLRAITRAGPLVDADRPIMYNASVVALQNIYRRQGLCGTFDSAAAGLRQLRSDVETHACVGGPLINADNKVLVLAQLANTLLDAAQSGLAAYSTLEALAEVEAACACAFGELASAPRSDQTVSWVWHCYGRCADLSGDAHAAANESAAAVSCYKQAVTRLERAAAALENDMASRSLLSLLQLKIKSQLSGSSMRSSNERNGIRSITVNYEDAKNDPDVMRVLANQMKGADLLEKHVSDITAARQRSADRRPDPFAPTSDAASVDAAPAPSSNSKKKKKKKNAAAA